MIRPTPGRSVGALAGAGPKANGIMPIPSTQAKRRRGCLGPLDSSALILDHAEAAPYDVWAAKCLGLPDVPDNEASPYLKDALLQYASDQTGIPLWRDQYRRRCGCFHATIGALSRTCPDVAFEAIAATVDAEWGEPGTDEVPAHVTIVCQHVMLVCPDVRVVYVAVVFGSTFSFHLFKVPRDPKLIGLVRKTGQGFWNRHVVPRIAPAQDARPPSITTIKRIPRIPNKTVRVDDPKALIEWRRATEASLIAQNAHDEAQSRLLALLGDSECLDFGPQYGRVTYFERSKRKRVAKAIRFRVAQFQKPKQSNQARVSAGCHSLRSHSTRIPGHA